ncbi:sulfur carrier protein ThiS [Virgibacillus sp. Bac330]|uniref:sulfur carrier protein ThiS n=1 Tax=Virgibacillus sp. Bac330 TaxID=2419841 RepID=UPI000EF480B4|nr:sulfur carrier protein ThiS [Virgibacillus sp. Bac330]
MELHVNGETLHFAKDTMTMLDLLEAYDIEEKVAAVEKNKEIIRKTDYSQTILEDGDRIEIVHFVGGG